MLVVMVCLGNICRSPMAEVVARTMVEQADLDGVFIESFGTSNAHEGERADGRAVDALRRGGWPEGNHRSKRLTPEALLTADLVLCADHANLTTVRRMASRVDFGGEISLLRRFDPYASPDDDVVPDPWSGNARNFDHALMLIERSCTGLVAWIKDSRTS